MILDHLKRAAWHAARALAAWTHPPGSVRKVLRGPARGMRFVVEPGMGLGYALHWGPHEVRFLHAKIARGMTVYDIGANKGQMALFFAACVGPTGRVVSFEPAPAEYASLTRNLALNRLANVFAIEAAAADATGVAAFSYSSAKRMQGQLAAVTGADAEASEVLEVRTRTLDHLLDEGLPVPEVIKIDVEGAGAAVLRGAGALLDRYSPAVYIEFHNRDEQAGVRDELLGRGYVAETLAGVRVADSTADWYSPLWCYRR
ncbi:MAG TPA: FkbM family methyltransferase [Pirellulales bacterium]|jgi:FkbM family methyltransferase|nr:FkbM family methyltransferase [Pirellulales bacterium]